MLGDMSENETYDVVVIGGGAAGLSGAMALGRSKRSVLVIEPDGEILGEATRATMGFRPELNKQRPFEEFLGDSGALVAASTRALQGIGFFLRADQTIWVFQQGSPFQPTTAPRTWVPLTSAGLGAPEPVADLTQTFHERLWRNHVSSLTQNGFH